VELIHRLLGRLQLPAAQLRRARELWNDAASGKSGGGVEALAELLTAGMRAETTTPAVAESANQRLRNMLSQTTGPTPSPARSTPCADGWPRTRLPMPGWGWSRS